MKRIDITKKPKKLPLSHSSGRVIDLQKVGEHNVQQAMDYILENKNALGISVTKKTRPFILNIIRAAIAYTILDNDALNMQNTMLLKEVRKLKEEIQTLKPSETRKPLTFWQRLFKCKNP